MKLTDKYYEEGLRVIAFPCNQVRIEYQPNAVYEEKQFLPCLLSPFSLRFAAHQFGNQEPKSNEDILKFASKFQGKDGVGADKKFIFMAKSAVNGSTANEVFSFLKPRLPSDDGSTVINW